MNPSLNLFGLDCCEDRIKRIPRNVYSQLVCADAIKIPFQDRSFDVVLAGEFLEHLTDSDVLKTLAEFYRILRDKGILLVTVPNPAYIRLKFTGEKIIGKRHLSEHYPMHLKMKLRDFGFAKIKQCGSGRVSNFLGEKCPFLSFYGSYLTEAEKNE